MVYRIYVEKRPEYAVEARGILSEIRHLLRIKSVTGLRLLNRYDVAVSYTHLTLPTILRV